MSSLTSLLSMAILFTEKSSVAIASDDHELGGWQLL